MDWVLRESMRGNGSLPPTPPPPAPPPPIEHGSKISPSILLIIVVVAAIFFFSGLLHLLIRCLLKPTPRAPDDTGGGGATALQGQLQQLFHLHDSGVDQLFIDSLPVFQYKAIIGLKDPFDCAVCLCEFEPDDKLRLLPKCSHAFHIHCIDTWLLSHSTCPLCRRSLIPDFSPGCSPLVLLLESESSQASPEADPAAPPDDSHDHHEEVEARVVPVKLGKFRSMESNAGQEESSNSNSNSNHGANLDQRRCFSLGAYEYVLDETQLQVAVKPSKKKPRIKKSRLAMSEWDCQSRREGFRGLFQPSGDDARVLTTKKDSFSVSKIWMQSKKERPGGSEDCSRRAFSFRLPLRRQPPGEEGKVNFGSSRRSSVRWEKGGSEMEGDVESGSCNNSIGRGSLAEEAPSFTRRTLLWIMGRQSKVGSHS